MGYPKSYAIKGDDVGGGVAYYGFALPGTASATSGWAIMKYTVSGAALKVEWANGDSKMDKDWNSRLGFTYSTA